MIALDDLNPNQQRAVEWDTGPLLVLAGLGAGKTVVLALRVVQLLEENEHASALALTFTNKAACRDAGPGGPKGTGAPRPEGRPAPARAPRGRAQGHRPRTERMVAHLRSGGTEL